MFEFVHGLGVLRHAAKDAAPDVRLAAELVKWGEFQNLGVFNILHAVVGKFIEQGFEYGASLLTVFAEHIAFLDVISPLAAGERFLVERNMCD